MIGWERYSRYAIAFSAVGHVAFLAGLGYVGANSVRPIRPEPLIVEIVPPNEAPPPAQEEQVDGTPLKSKTTGSEAWSDSEKGSAAAGRPQPKTAFPSLQQSEGDSKRQRAGKPAVAQKKATKPTEPETQPEASEPLLSPTAKLEPQPNQNEAANKPQAGDVFAMPLALPGGQVGAGLDAPSEKPAMLSHDEMAAFRTHLTLCSHLPPWIDKNAAIGVRISFKRDGTLATRPQLLGASPSADAAFLMAAVVDALEKCQPFSELSPDNYKKWKTISFVITPLALPPPEE